MARKVIKIPIEKLYHPYKESLQPFYDKFFVQDENPLLWKNVPISVFACDYLRLGDEVTDMLDDHPFIRYEYERYHDSETVLNDTHKFIAAQRVIKMVKSVKKHGYAEGKYNSPRHLIRVSRGFSSPYGKDKEGFTLLARKHRASACLALGINSIRVKLTSSSR